jgi:hypothetical protein
MYGVRINYNDGKPDAVQYLNYDASVDCGHYLSPNLLEPDVYGSPGVAQFVIKTLITFLLDGMTDEIHNKETDAMHRRDDWLEVLMDITVRHSTDEISPAGYIHRADRLPFYQKMTFDVVVYAATTYESHCMPSLVS